VPIYMGARGPRMLTLAGEIADGTIIAWPCSPGYVAWAREYITVGAAKTERRDRHRVPCFCLFSIDADGKKAKNAIRGILAWALAALGECPPTDVYGISEELVDMIARGGASTVEREMPEQWLEDLAIAGDYEECAAKIQRYLEAGADSVVLYPYHTELAGNMLSLAAAHAVPRLPE
jgi:5,10-methylenetetrahydromethanopterin reductase